MYGTKKQVKALIDLHKTANQKMINKNDLFNSRMILDSIWLRLYQLSNESKKIVELIEKYLNDIETGYDAAGLKREISDFAFGSFPYDVKESQKLLNKVIKQLKLKRTS
jgi:hypothetical protein